MQFALKSPLVKTLSNSIGDPQNPPELIFNCLEALAMIVSRDAKLADSFCKILPTLPLRNPIIHLGNMSNQLNEEDSLQHILTILSTVLNTDSDSIKVNKCLFASLIYVSIKYIFNLCTVFFLLVLDKYLHFLLLLMFCTKYV